MYIPPHFAESDSKQIERIIRDHPLGMLVTQVAGELDANHVPFEFDPGSGHSGLLTAHVARNNPVWRSCADGDSVLVVFRGAESYISPSWYPSKHETHRQVPTWNYELVHAHGAIRVMDDEKFVRRMVATLTRSHEKGEEKPWKMGDAPRDYLDQMLAMIVGIEIDVQRLECKRKLSQNKDNADVLGAVSALRSRGKDELANAMRSAEVN